MTDRKKLFVIDGYGQIYRSYFAFVTNPLKDKNGNNVSAVYGFFHTLMMLIRNYHPTYLVVALDSKGKTFRHDMFPEYKANREKTPEDLHAQIPVITDILDKMNISHYARQGMEADDIIATLAQNALKSDIETVMVTGDKDLLQLVRDGVSALRPPRKGEKEYRLCHDAEVREIFGVSPNQIVDYLTILGDSSDNVPGIDGIGEKGAVKLLSEFQHLSDVYEAIVSLPKGIQSKLEAARDHIELSKTLIELKDDLFELSEQDFSQFECNLIDWEKGALEFDRLGSDSLVKAAMKFSGKAFQSPVSQKKQVEFVDIDLDNPKALIGHGLKDKIKELGTSSVAAFDTEIAAWLLASDSARFGFDDVCEKYLGTKEIPRDEALKKLYSVLGAELKEKELWTVFEDLELPLIPVLASMEKEGIILDTTKLAAFGKDLTKTCEETEKAVFDLVGHDFNLNSPKQLQEVLFSERKLEPVRKTKSGFSTDSDVLQLLADTSEDPVPGLILRYRGLSKLLSTYVSALPQMVDPSSGSIHTTFLQTGTATGRLSSKNPNLQNIPIRTEEGRRIRDAFVPEKGSVLLSADYSQIELVVLAHLSRDEELCRAFRNGEDIHTATAALVFGLFPEMVSPQQRRMAKTINFGIMYGMGAFSLAQDLKISRKEAQSFIDAYFERFSGVKRFIDSVKQQAKADGFVRTAMGHIRYIPEMQMSNKAVVAGAERVAVNSVIQGTAAEIMKRAMLSIYSEMKKQKVRSKLLLQVHDEVIIEVPEDEIQLMENLVRKSMTEAAQLSIPLRVSIETGASWGCMH